MPPGFELMGSTDSCPIAALADEERKFYALQFHPDVTHTTQGEAIIGRFVNEICGCKSDWNIPAAGAGFGGRALGSVGDVTDAAQVEAWVQIGEPLIIWLND